MIFRGKEMKCRFFKTCKEYNRTSPVCKNNNTAKHFYGLHRPCGCYRKMKEEKCPDQSV